MNLSEKPFLACLSIAHVGFRKEGIQDRRDSGLEGNRKRRIQERRDSRLERYRKREIQESYTRTYSPLRPRV